MKCNQTGCKTPNVTGIKFRLWVGGDHYDHRTLKAAINRFKRLSWYERQMARFVDVDGKMVWI